MSCNRLTPWSWDQGLCVWINFIVDRYCSEILNSLRLCVWVHMYVKTRVCMCVNMCVNVHVYVDVHTNTWCWCWCHLCYSLPFILRQAPPLNVELADLARLAGQWTLGDLPVSPFQDLDCKHWIQYSAFLYGYWGLNSGSQVFAASTFLTKPSLQSWQT